MKISSLFKIAKTKLTTIVNYHKNISLYGKDNCILVNYFKGVPNWGDDLNEYLIEKVSGKKVVIYPYSKKKHILGIGSILHRAKNNSVVWGSGFISEKSSTQKNLDIKLLRGPKTAKKLNWSGLEFGDPGICIRNFYFPDIKKKYRYGLIPHHVDKMHPAVLKLTKREDVLLIDIQQDIEPFIEQLLSCERIISSSLHGLIASDSYSIPNLHVVFSDKLLGGKYKFDDYALGISGKVREAHTITEDSDIESFDKEFYFNAVSDEKIAHILNLFPRNV